MPMAGIVEKLKLGKTKSGGPAKKRKFKLPHIKFKAFTGPALLSMGLVLIVLWFSLINDLKPITLEPSQEISVSRVFDLSERHEIKGVQLNEEDATLLVALNARQGYAYWARYPKSDAATSQIIDAVRLGGGEARINPQGDKGSKRFLVQFLLPLLILACLFSFFFLLITGGGGSGAGEFFNFSKSLAKITNRKKGKGAVTFADVAGNEEGLMELKEAVDYLMDPTKFQLLGAKAPKGILLAGPPGTGKTLLAKATAGEANVPFFSMAGSEFVEALVGIGAARVRDLFRKARANAPCLIFIDELDACGRQRGAGVGQGNDEREQTLNQMLAEMDGFDVSAGVVIMGATNRPDILDPALLRPGRFDRQVIIDVPDVIGREAILRVHARNRPMAPDADLLTIAKQTPGFTGAELANIMNEAALLAVRAEHTGIDNQDLDEAVERTLSGPARKGHLLTAQEKVLVAYHEVGHAIVARAVGQQVGIMKLSIVARGRQLGHATVYQQADKLVVLKSECESELTALLGGLAAENMIFGEISTGNTGDLEKATDLARKMVATWGMTHEVGRVTIQKAGAQYLGRDAASLMAVSQTVLESVDREIQNFIEEAEHRAEKILRANKKVMDELAKALLEHETLNHEAAEPFLNGVRPVQAAGDGRGLSRSMRAASTALPRASRR
ncbi:MAG: ATP-dependent zinc metalloprotease FtsH [Actinomycetota bacterium]